MFIFIGLIIISIISVLDFTHLHICMDSALVYCHYFRATSVSVFFRNGGEPLKKTLSLHVCPLCKISLNTFSKGTSLCSDTTILSSCGNHHCCTSPILCYPCSNKSSQAEIHHEQTTAEFTIP